MRVGLTLALWLSLTGLPALAEQSTVQSRYSDCIAARDWRCGFETLVDFMASAQGLSDCTSARREGCAFLVFGLYTFGALAAQDADHTARIQLADRALRALRPINHGLADRVSADFFFSTLKFVTCEAMADHDCRGVAESAMARQIAVMHQHDLLDQLLADIELVEDAKEGFGVTSDLLGPMKSARLSVANAVLN